MSHNRNPTGRKYTHHQRRAGVSDRWIRKEERDMASVLTACRRFIVDRGIQTPGELAAQARKDNQARQRWGRETPEQP